MAILLFSISLYNESLEINHADKLNGKNASGEFLVLSEPAFYDDFNRVILKTVKSDYIPRGMSFTVIDNNSNNYAIGDIISTDLKIKPIDAKYKFYNYGNSIYANAKIDGPVKFLSENSFYKFCGNVRMFAKETISGYFDGDSAGLMLAITTGDKSLIGNSFSDNIKITGISHVIVVSGLHLSIIISAVFLLLNRFLYNKYIKAVLSVAVCL